MKSIWIDCDGSKAWYKNGKLHREDGTVQIFSTGKTIYYYHGEYIDCKNTEEFW